MYEVELAPAAQRALEVDLPVAAAAAVFETISGTIAANPHRAGSRLKPPFDGEYAARRGPYRIVYTVDDGSRVVRIRRIRHRRDAYRR